MYLHVECCTTVGGATAAIYSSQEEGTKDFVYDSIVHGWDIIEAVL